MNFFRKPGTSEYKGLQDFINALPETEEMVEVGSAYGESGAIFAKTINKVHCIDPWTNDREKFFDELNGNNPNIIKHKGLGKDVVNEFDSVDGVYIDGNHTYKCCKEDIQMWLPKATKWIGGHDYNLRFAGVALAVCEELTEVEVHGGLVHPQLFADSSWLIIL